MTVPHSDGPRTTDNLGAADTPATVDTPATANSPAGADTPAANIPTGANSPTGADGLEPSDGSRPSSLDGPGYDGPGSDSPGQPTPRQLRPPQHRLERSVVWLWILQALVFPGLLLIGSIVAYVLWETARPWLIVALVVAGLGTLVSIAVEPFWRFRVHRWEVTEEAVYARTGWLVKEWRVAPISRIQTVDSVRGPFEQLLGLATLRVTTASSSGAIEINGLAADVAADVAERLTIITERTPGDAT